MPSAGIFEYIGHVANFTNCTHINNDKIDDFEFALTLDGGEPNQPPTEDVFYLDPVNKDLMVIIDVVASAWKTRKKIQVFLEAGPRKMVVASVSFV